MLETNKTILKKANEAVSNGNYEEFLKYCTDDTKWTFIGDQVLHGKEAVRKWMLKEYIEPPIIHVEKLIGEHDDLTALGHITVFGKKGEERQYAYCDVWKFREGKMAELMAYVIESKST
ncbi:nuclear transport factor 2 family protein [Sinomicrobium weinanense]|uniref:Nuclear transport factor 2 family protein n=1 Tax=Sinomicrobium weinanense TaxID=2842200 RepID=A0A926Q2E3_9FLAO|nr:nuclear transport factor 2 family protein [Sinomicrobium weinanense]MBC9796433.1 nuclear transport factor 2 family protein [Sinomicrobium weinanense]MBU3125893.1 nuclear transport factor 2 family protein [Sinomicrobium weinanense]